MQSTVITMHIIVSLKLQYSYTLRYIQFHCNTVLLVKHGDTSQP